MGKPSRFVRWSVPRTRTVTRTRNLPPYSLASSRNAWRGNTAHGIRYRSYPSLSERNIAAWKTWFISPTWYNVYVLQCSKTCGEGQQIRAIQCINITSETLASDCDLSAKPAEIQSCNPDPCPSGHSGSYLHCSSNVSLFNHVNDLNMLIIKLIIFFFQN